MARSKEFKSIKVLLGDFVTESKVNFASLYFLEISLKKLYW